MERKEAHQQKKKLLIYKEMGMNTTVLMNSHLLTLEMIQLQFDLLSNGRS